MTASNEAQTPLRGTLLADLQRAVDGLPHTHNVLLKEQLARAGQDEADLAPGLLCLLVAEAESGSFEAARPSATALGLVGLMGRTFADIRRSEQNGPLASSWGLPRTLNAG